MLWTSDMIKKYVKTLSNKTATAVLRNLVWFPGDEMLWN